MAIVSSQTGKEGKPSTSSLDIMCWWRLQQCGVRQGIFWGTSPLYRGVGDRCFASDHRAKDRKRKTNLQHCSYSRNSFLFMWEASAYTVGNLGIGDTEMIFAEFQDGRKTARKRTRVVIVIAILGDVIGRNLMFGNYFLLLFSRFCLRLYCSTVLYANFTILMLTNYNLVLAFSHPQNFQVTEPYLGGASEPQPIE